jgi:hypothetical protein
MPRNAFFFFVLYYLSIVNTNSKTDDLKRNLKSQAYSLCNCSIMIVLLTGLHFDNTSLRRQVETLQPIQRTLNTQLCSKSWDKFRLKRNYPFKHVIWGKLGNTINFLQNINLWKLIPDKFLCGVFFPLNAIIFWETLDKNLNSLHVSLLHYLT